MFEKLGYQVYLWNASDDLDVETESNDLYKFLVTFGITLVFGINVSRSAIIISKATSRFKVPYVLMVAGTGCTHIDTHGDSCLRLRPDIVRTQVQYTSDQH